jgi:hypothetical protein
MCLIVNLNPCKLKRMICDFAIASFFIKVCNAWDGMGEGWGQRVSIHRVMYNIHNVHQVMYNIVICKKKSKNFIIKFQAYLKEFVVWWERKPIYKYCTPSNVQYP